MGNLKFVSLIDGRQKGLNPLTHQISNNVKSKVTTTFKGQLTQVAKKDTFSDKPADNQKFSDLVKGKGIKA